jgi:CHAD domain-containing protein
MDAVAPATPAPVTRPRQVLLSAGEHLGAAGQRALAIGLENLIAHGNGTVAGDVEPIHQLRVATRRLRATVELFDRVFHTTRAKIYRRDLRWAGHTAGGVRECDVWGELLRALAAKLEPSLRDSLAPAYQALAERRRVELAKVVELVESEQYQRLMARLASPLVKKSPPEATVGAFVIVTVRRAVASISRAGSRLEPSSSPELFHRLRIRLKRLRYMLEMLRDIGGKRARKAIRRLEDMQELLGSQHDAVTAIAWLREFACSAGVPPQTLLATGALIQSLDKRAAKLAARSVRRWKKLERSGILADAVAALAASAHAATQTDKEMAGTV